MSNREALKEALRQKITSYEQLASALRNSGFTRVVENPGSYSPGDEALLGTYGVDRYLSASIVNAMLGTQDDNVSVGRVIWKKAEKDQTWWWYREQMRSRLDVYPRPTTVLENIIAHFDLSPFCVHPSTDKDNPAAVAYTPDQASGVADRQVKVSSLAKLIKKMCILVTDEYAQKLEAAHRAELDPTFFIATTPSEIQNVYQNMAGDSGCMRYDGNVRWSLPDGMHPSHVYAAENVGVAYHTRADGTILSRAVVFELNGTKHYLRLYGDGALRRKLHTAGYSERSLAGVKIKAVKIEDGDYTGHYVVPYIDGKGGAQGDYDGTWGYIDARDPEHVQLLTAQEASKLRNMGMDVQQFKNYQSTIYRLTPQDMSTIKGVCPISGIAFDRSKDATIKVFYWGKEQYAIETGDVLRRFPLTLRSETGNGNCFYPAGTPYFLSSGVGHVMDTEKNRLAAGHVKLDETLYPDNRDWVDSTQTTMFDGKRVLISDTIVAFHADSTNTRILASHLEDRKVRKEWTEKGYSINGRGASRYAIHKDHGSALERLGGGFVHAAKTSLIRIDPGYAVDGKYVHSFSTWENRFTCLNEEGVAKFNRPDLGVAATLKVAAIDAILQRGVTTARSDDPVGGIAEYFRDHCNTKAAAVERLVALQSEMGRNLRRAFYYGPNNTYRQLRATPNRDGTVAFSTSVYDELDVEAIVALVDLPGFADLASSAKSINGGTEGCALYLQEIVAAYKHLSEAVTAPIVELQAEIAEEQRRSVEDINRALVEAGLEPIEVLNQAPVAA
jgi:hypothetical protein